MLSRNEYAPASTITADDVDGYLRRLQLEVEPPSVAALHRLHRAQVEHVAYESIWIQLREGWGIDPAESVRHVIDGRGGYCFQLNGAFAELLTALGYRVTRHVGGVHGQDGPAESEMFNHLVLMVHDLPSNENPGGTWYMDAGLGDGLFDPLPLIAGEYDQGPLHFVLTRTDDGIGDWHLAHDPTGSFTGMSFRSAAVPMSAFAARHQYLSTSPESSFVKVCAVYRRRADGVDVMRGQVLTTSSGGSRKTRTIEQRDEWFAVLANLFELRLDHPPERLDALWTSVHAGHQAWLARPENR